MLFLRREFNRLACAVFAGKSPRIHRHIAILAICLGVVMPAVAKTTVTFEEHAIVARVTPGASTAWLAITQQWNGYRQKLVYTASILVDEDRDGIVRLVLVDASRDASVFMITDLSNGDHAVAAPPDRKLRREKLPPSALKLRDKDKKAHVLHRETFATFWLVRPGVGAWLATVEDGSALDQSTTFDGYVAGLLERMEPVGNSPPAPDDFERDDIVAAIEPLTLQIFDGVVK